MLTIIVTDASHDLESFSATSWEGGKMEPSNPMIYLPRSDNAIPSDLPLLSLIQTDASHCKVAFDNKTFDNDLWRAGVNLLMNIDSWVSLDRR